MPSFHPARLASFARRLIRGFRPSTPRDAGDTVADYWTRYNVTLHHRFTSPDESLAYFRWRNDQYFGYIDLMPVTGQDGRVVLDFGCGPGHDLVGFACLSRPARLIGVDVSPASVAEAKARLKMHGAACEIMLLPPDTVALPFPTGSIDYVHSSGVLHHVSDPQAVLREFRRVLRPDGAARVMVYNRDSLWMHLLVAFLKRIREGRYQELSLEDAFARTTDGEDCPIARVYRPDDFVALAGAAGLEARCTGAALSMTEAKIAPLRFDAIQDRRLPEESRRFLLDLTFDEHGLPRYQGRLAGIDGCYQLRVRT
jgi:SAM-dependent methyltransferase